MNKFSMKKLLSILLCIALIAALALSTVGCSKNDNTAPATTAEASGVVSMGEGETSFLFNVVDPEGKESHFEIHTDEKTVGAALLSLGLIAGEDSEYGLYVKTVNGVTVDYDQDGKYRRRDLHLQGRVISGHKAAGKMVLTVLPALFCCNSGKSSYNGSDILRNRRKRNGKRRGVFEKGRGAQHEGGRPMGI